MNTIKHKFQIYSKQGKLVKSNLNSRATVRFLGGDFAMGNDMLKRICSGELVEYRGYFVFQSDSKKVFDLHYKNYLEKEKIKLSDGINHSINRFENNTILKLNSQFEIIDVYYPSNLQSIADSLDLPLGTVKSKLSRDIGKIRRILDGEFLKSESEFRLVYLSDMKKLT